MPLLLVKVVVVFLMFNKYNYGRKNVITGIVIAGNI